MGWGGGDNVVFQMVSCSKKLDMVSLIFNGKYFPLYSKTELFSTNFY